MKSLKKNLITPVIASPQVTRHILAKYKLTAHKKLGQNFLIDHAVVEQIVSAAELTPSDTVLEIGPGIGTLTQGLAESNAKVIAVELDQRLIPVLQTTLADYSNISIIHGDILKIDIAKETQNNSFKCCANLPYYITTPIIFNILEKKLNWERLVFMVQKEVAERIVAKPGGKEYGELSVAMQFYTQPTIACTVPPTSFIPMPQVESAVLVCKHLSQPPVNVNDEALFFKIVKAAFSMRRKMLNNSLKNMGLDNDYIKAWLTRANIDGNRRAETLSLQEFADLSNSYK
ncbi:MAG: 16S rRNA (adenine(1518)-N(6)/adenine(1519)-N(6))-dimethyltransferase RsmA [Phascolarctobacterium sp.]|nr:16S rRNA (adenine(1518)-N(6)/adenine(1519)-N(6))-dimethyltransferase RsmA [Candidatus Phascolarctobacterium caballi]